MAQFATMTNTIGQTIGTDKISVARTQTTCGALTNTSQRATKTAISAPAPSGGNLAFVLRPLDPFVQSYAPLNRPYVHLD